MKRQYETVTRCYRDYINYGADLREEMGLKGWKLVAVDPINHIFFYQKAMPLNYNVSSHQQPLSEGEKHD